MEAGKRAPHTQTAPRSATGQVSAFHLAALPWVRRWSQRSRLYGVWVPGAAQPSRWLLRTIWLGYAIQFDRRPPKFRGIHLIAVKAADTHVLWEESLSYWRRTWWYQSLQPIWRQGFSALTSLCPRKAVGYDQSWVCASWTGHFINLLSRCSCRTTSLDASVPKFGLQHLTRKTRISICRSFRATGHSCGLRSKDEHISILPFGLSISPCVFTKVAEAALVPLREQGVRILNYLDDWLILAQSQDQLCEHRDLVLSHLSQLGLWVNWEKSKLLPMQRISSLSMEFGFGQSDCAPHAGTRSVGVKLLEYVQEQDGGTTETVSEAPGAYGGCGSGHTAGAAPYETASTLAPWPSHGKKKKKKHTNKHISIFHNYTHISTPRQTDLTNGIGHYKAMQIILFYSMSK